MTELERLAGLTQENAVQTLMACCGSNAWATKLAAWIAEHSSASVAGLLETSSQIWFGLAKADWLEAFACHPRIGESRPAATGFLAHSSAEQAAAQQSLAAVAPRLAEANRAYEANFGFVYLVFASGRTAPELLALLERRLRNTRAEELQEAARQQDLITRLRLERWLAR